MRLLLLVAVLLQCHAVPLRAEVLQIGDILAAAGEPFEPGTLYRVDPATGDFTPLVQIPGGSVVAETADTALFRLFGGGADMIARIRLDTGAWSIVSIFPRPAPDFLGLFSFAAGGNGRIFAVRPDGICDVDPEDGTQTLLVPGEFWPLAVDPRGQLYSQVTVVEYDTVELVRVYPDAGTYEPLGDVFEGGRLELDANGNRYVYVAPNSIYENTLLRTAGSPAGVRTFAHHEETDGQIQDFALTSDGHVIAGGNGVPEADASNLQTDVARYDAVTGEQTPIADLPGSVSSIDVYLPEPGAPLLTAVGFAVLLLRRRR